MRRSRRMVRFAILAALTVLVAASACSTGAGNAGAPGVPSARSDASSAYDPSTGSIVMFGGVNRSGLLAETWTWDGHGWRLHHPAHSPSARERSLMAFDPAQSRVVLFGGLTCPAAGPDDPLGCEYSSVATPLRDTWLWDGSDWTRLSTAHAPEFLNFAPTMAGLGTDVADKQVVAVNWVKIVNSASVLETWTLKDGDWVQMHPHHAPPDLEFGGPSFDAVSGRLIVQQSRGPHIDCGGSTQDCSPRVLYDMTWSWDGSDWHDLGPEVAAPHEYGRLIDAGRGGVVFIGEPGAFHEWNGKTWSAPLALPWGAVLRTGWTGAFDPNTDQIILFGGRTWGTNHLFGDTMGWSGSTWRTLVAALPSPSTPLAACDPKAAMAGYGGYGGGPSISPTSTALGIAFFEPKAGPCHLDVVVQFSMTDHDGALLPITGNPSQVEVIADLTYDYGFEYATFTITNACRLPQSAMARFTGADLDAEIPAVITRDCPNETGAVTITAGTLHRPDEK